MKKFKRIISLMLSLVMLISMLPAGAFSASAAAVKSGSCGPNATYTLDRVSGLLTISGTGAIESSAFENNTTIKDVVIEEGITNIEYSAFRSCTELKTVKIPDSVTIISDSSFLECSSLQSVTIPNGIDCIERSAFSYCNKLTSVTLPDGLIDIKEAAFEGCDRLTSIVIPDTVTNIGDRAFSGCEKLKDIKLPKGLKNIGAHTFAGCFSLTNINLPYGITSVNSGTFSVCESLEIVKLPSSVVNIGEYAFNSCLVLTGVYIPNMNCTIYDSAETFPQDTIIYGLKGSTAESYATKYNRTFAELKSCGPDAYYYLDGATGKLTVFGTGVINCNAFYACNNIKSVVIEDGITHIKEASFRACMSLTNITIPRSVTSIDFNSFSLCPELKSIKVEIGNTVYDSRDNCNAIIETSTNTLIAGCKNTLIPNTVTSIGNSAFDGCKSLKSIYIPNSVTSIDDFAFEACESLTSIVIPKSVTSIGNSAFYECSPLTDITILNKDCVIFDNTKTINSATTIHGYKGSTAETYATKYNRAFVEMGSCGKTATYEFNTKTGELVISGTGMVHAPTLFTGNANIKKVVINEGITKVNYDVFKNCTGITEVTLPKSLTEFGDYAFNGCTSLTTVNIPPRVKYINYGVFSGCTALTDAYVYSPDVTYQDTNLEEKLAYPKTTTLHAVAGSSTEKFANNKGYNFVALNIQTGKAGPTADYILYTDSGLLYVYGTGAINDNAFEQNASIKSAVIGDGITSLGNSAFEGCTALTSIDIPKGVTSIGANIFSNCTVLTSIDIPKGVKIISAYAFSNCPLLTSVTIPNSVISIGNSAFEGCTALTNIDIPNGVKSIENYAFNICTALTSLEIPNSVTSIGTVVPNCTALTDITVAEGNTVYDSRDNCNAIIETSTNKLIAGCKNTIIPNSVTSIGLYGFYQCKALTSIEIPNSVTSIGLYAFFGCNSLTIIKIPKSVTSIDDSAFGACSSLTNIAIFNKDCVIYYMPHTINNTATIHGFKGSTAESYAAKYGRTFVEFPKCGPDAYYYLDEATGELTIFGTGSIDSMAFMHNTNIKSVVIEEGITSIENDAFNNCTELTSVKLPNSLNSIGTAVFKRCIALKDICLPDSITTISDEMFLECHALTNFVISNSITSIGNDAFYGCNSLISMTLPSNVTSVGNRAFGSCKALTDITILNKECVLFNDVQTISYDTVVHGYKGSTAESYAKNCYHPFEKLVCDVHTDGTPVKENEIKPTFTHEGSYDLVTYCPVCGEIIKIDCVVVPVRTDCKINIVDEGLGSVTGLNFGENLVKKDTEFTVTVTVNPGAEFLGWYINNNLVSTELTYTGVAKSDLTITPKFQVKGSDLIYVTFIDKWGNIVNQYSNITPEAFQTEMQKGIPTTPNVGGYKFIRWDMTNDEILNLNHSQTIRAIYEIQKIGYTVTTNAQKMTIGSGQENGQIKFDTLVSLYDPDATVWKIGNVIVGYGNTYSFYVGSDVEIQPFNDPVATEKPTTTIINTSLEDDGVLVDFLATRTVPKDFTLVDSGFVFGKTVDTNALVVENANQVVDGVNIRISLCTKGGADQFLLPYGVKAKTGTIGVRSFVTYKTADGEIQTVYSEVAQYTYAPTV